MDARRAQSAAAALPALLGAGLLCAGLLCAGLLGAGLLGAGPAAAAAPARAIALDPTVERHDLTGALEILEDPGGTWTIADVTAAPLSRRFEPVEELPLDLGITSSAYWLRFTLLGGPVAASGWTLSAETYYIDSFQVYTPDPAAAHDGATGRRSWQVRGWGHEETGAAFEPILAPLAVTPDGTTPVYLRVRSASPLYFRGLEVQTGSAAVLHAQRWSLFLGVFFGAMAVVILINLILAVSLRRRTYLYGALYQMALVGYLLGRNGMLYWLHGQPPAAFFLYFHVVGIGLIVIATAAFTRGFLRTRRTAPRMDRLVLVYMGLAVLMLLVTPVAPFPVLMWWTIGLGLMTPFATLGPGIQRLRRGFRPARLFLLAWSVFALSAALFAAPVDLGVDGALIFQVGGGINAVLLTLAVADDVRSLRRQRETAVEALGESEDRYRAIFQTAGAGMIIFGDDGVITLANDAFARLTGHTRDEIEGRKTWRDFVVGAGLDAAAGWPDAAAAGPGPAAAAAPGVSEARLRDRAGNLHDSLVSLGHVPGTGQRIASFQDVTERKRFERQMVQADKMAALGQIIAGVAHEINNPNNFIYFNLPILRQYVEAVRPILEDRRATEPDLRLMKLPVDGFVEDLLKLLETMEHGSQRIAAIVSELKNYVRSDDSEQMKPAPIAPVVERLMALTGKQVRKMVRHFDVTVAEALPPVRMNPGKIEQVLINLVINAGQAADKEDSRVTLDVRRAPDDDGVLRITVEDNGAGIPEENLGRIFEPFYTSKGREEGTGLGLSISQRIIEQHDGTIDVTSVPGEGTRFTIRLPLVTAATAPPDAPPDAAPAAPPAGLP